MSARLGREGFDVSPEREQPEPAAGEKLLLERVRQGDLAAMDELLSRHERDVYRFGLRMCGSEDAAKEVLQQTLLAAFRNIRQYRGDAKLSTWLYQIARSFCSKWHRGTLPANTSLDSLEALAVPAAQPTPEDSARAREVGAALTAAIQALPPAQREVLVLRDIEGLSAEEAAEVLGIEVANLKSRLHRGRAELRKQLVAVLDPSVAPCRELAHDLSDLVSEEVDQAACARIEEHLATCSQCATACDALNRTVSLCRSIPGDDVPPTVRAAVRNALQNSRPRFGVG
jgi:RNA polymerase sigma-70 factor, ECF subfamily